MNKPVFTSNRVGFLRKNDAFVDMVTGHMAMDIEVALKTTAGMPVSNTIASGNKRGGGGHMKASTSHFRDARGKFRVLVNKEYAGVQNLGVRLTGRGAPAVMQNYSTPGTSHHFFNRAIASVTQHRMSYIEEAAKALGLK